MIYFVILIALSLFMILVAIFDFDFIFNWGRIPISREFDRFAVGLSGFIMLCVLIYALIN